MAPLQCTFWRHEWTATAIGLLARRDRKFYYRLTPSASREHAGNQTNSFRGHKVIAPAGMQFYKFACMRALLCESQESCMNFACMAKLVLDLGLTSFDRS